MDQPNHPSISHIYLPKDLTIPEIPPLPFPVTRLSDNEPLSQQEVDSTKTFVDEVDGMLLDMKKERTRLEATAHALLSHCESLKAQEARLLDLRTHNAWRVTVPSRGHNLPAEILSRIFLHHQKPFRQTPYSLTFPSDMEFQNSLAIGEGPLVLTWVCRRWRQVAIVTPKLWSSLRLIVDKRFYSFDEPVEKKSFLLQLWFLRRRDIPLHVQVIDTFETWGDLGFESRRKLAGIVDYFRRCRSVTVFAPFKTDIRLQAYFPRDVMLPLLEELRIMDLDPTHGIVLQQQPPPVNAPKLHTVALNRLDLLPFVGLGPSFDTIRHLELDVIDYQSSESIRGLLVSRPSLESLTLGAVYREPITPIGSTDDPRYVVHTNLKRLHLNFRSHEGSSSGPSRRRNPGAQAEHDAASLVALFGTLRLPALIDFRINSITSHPWSDPAFHRFLSDSQNLESLALITRSRIEPTQILSYLDLLPSLRDLHIDIPVDLAEDTISLFRERSSTIGDWPAGLPALYLYPDRSRATVHIASIPDFFHTPRHLGCFYGKYVPGSRWWLIQLTPGPGAESSSLGKITAAFAALHRYL